ncbi:MAG: putative lipid II flippase FtsW [Actinomycetota bacterium]|nr:putative lipid II flippase FtsW [Actinomycetota bacterium]
MSEADVSARRRSAAARAVLLVAVVAVLCLVGLVMVLSSSSVHALQQYGSSWVFFWRQLMWVVLGSVALVVTARVDYRRWRSAGPYLLAAAVMLLIAVLVPGVGVKVNGSARWLGLGAWRIQPAEVAKLALLLFCSGVLARRLEGRPGAEVRLAPALLPLGLVGLLIMLQPDMGTTLVMASLVFAVLYVAGARLRAMAGLAGAAVAGAFVLGMAEPYRRARMLSFLNPWADASNTGYQVVQSLVGMGTGRLIGVGIGASRAKWGFLPNAHTDFIFAIVGEEMGLVGALLLLSLFAGFAVLGMRAAGAAPDPFGRLLAVGITAWVTSQAFINLGAVVGVLPVSGVPLPFVSFGGSSLVILMAAVGMLINITRQGGPPTPRGSSEPLPRRRSEAGRHRRRQPAAA